jgi:hypothetical protein
MHILRKVLVVIGLTGAFVLLSPVGPTASASQASPRPPGFSHWPRSQLVKWPSEVGAAIEIAYWNNSVYAASGPPPLDAKSKVERFSYPSGRIEAETAFPVQIGIISLVTASGSVWVLGREGSARVVLYKLNSQTLSVNRTFQFAPTSGGSIATDGQLLWVGTGDSLLQMLPSSGVLWKLSVKGPVMHLAVSPSSGRLYDVVRIGTGDVIEERNLVDGALLASNRSEVQAVSVGGLSADPLGVWASIVGGTSATLARYSINRLRQTVMGREGSLSGTNAMQVFDTRISLWWEDFQDVECLNPSSGATISKTVIAATSGGLAPVGNDLLVTTPTGITKLIPPVACTRMSLR